MELGPRSLRSSFCTTDNKRARSANKNKTRGTETGANSLDLNGRLERRPSNVFLPACFLFMMERNDDLSTGNRGQNITLARATVSRRSSSQSE